MPYITSLDHVADRADRLLDRNIGIQARRAVNIDVVDAEAFQRIGKEVLDRRRAGVVTAPVADRIA
ncbi:hypothetical protein FHT97_001590 [Rhizobium sp. BK399]|nr:hypothetical protein [Rhizobium sp. BK399]